jgi:hypothetical protein
MEVVFEGRLHVDYAQAYVVPTEAGSYDDPGPDEAFAGQVNGLLGAACPGCLHLTTGLHMGDVGLRVVLAEAPPPVGDEWEDVVEVPFRPIRSELGVMTWSTDFVCTLELPPVPHRVRYSARGMDAAHAADVARRDGSVVDTYELAFWPAAPAPEVIVRQGSQQAAYWHEARNPETAEANRIRSTWGDDPPSARLVHVVSARWLVAHDRGLAEEVAAAEPGVQRALAFWAVQRACDEAGISHLDWIAAALAAMHRGDDLPPPFDHPARMYERLDADERAPRTRITLGGHPDLPRAPMALSATLFAVRGDPLDAAVSTLTQACQVFGDGRQDVLLREAAEVLRSSTEPAARRASGPEAPATGVRDRHWGDG